MGQGGPLSLSTGDHDNKCSMGCGNMNFGECDGLCSPFHISDGRIAMLVEVSAESFKGDSVE